MKLMCLRCLYVRFPVKLQFFDCGTTTKKLENLVYEFNCSGTAVKRVRAHSASALRGLSVLTLVDYCNIVCNSSKCHFLMKNFLVSR